MLAWGTLNTLLPLTLGILALAGFVLRDPARPAPVGARAGGGSVLAGKLIGLAGLAVAALLLRGQHSAAATESSAR